MKRVIIYFLIGALIFGAGLATGGLRYSRERLIDLYKDIREAITPSSPGNFTSKHKVEVLNTALVNFDLSWINPDAPLPQEGGGMVAVADGVLIAKPADGTLLFLDRSKRSLERLALRLPPLNRDKLPNRTPGGKKVEDQNLRYNDLEIVEIAGAKHLVVSYDYYYPDRQCFVSRLASIALPDGWRNNPGFKGDDWKVVFESTPCLGFFEGTRHAVGAHQSGGRLAYAPDGKLYMTIGDYEFDGLDGKGPAYPQIKSASYGKIWRFDPTTWKPEMVSMGHRNPQGITALPDGNIWAVEHGPQGGDELNHILPGRNYGWPHVTLGVNYTHHRQTDAQYWPFNPKQGQHDGFEPPVYAWVPSIAVSNIKYIQGLTPRWDGDFLVSTLNGFKLYRLRMTNGHVLYQEPIEIGTRIRYAEIAHGNIYLLTDSGLVGIMTPHKMTEQHVQLGQATTPDAAATSPLARNGCVECHSSPSLPNLAKVFGADIASQKGVAYSEGLHAAKGIWNKENLKAFLASPDAFAKGSTMPSPNLSEEDLNSVVSALSKP